MDEKHILVSFIYTTQNRLIIESYSSIIRYFLFWPFTFLHENRQEKKKDIQDFKKCNMAAKVTL